MTSEIIFDSYQKLLYNFYKFGIELLLQIDYAQCMHR